MLSTLKEGLHFLKRRVNVQMHGFKEYKGDAEEISKQIVKECFNGNFFQASTGNFDCFFLRDFAYCAEALMELGYNTEVYKTLQYALTVYSNNNRLTTTILKGDIPADMFYYSPDSLPLLLRSLRVSKNKELVEIYKPFIEEQTKLYYNVVFDEQTQMVKKRKFSSIKDHAIRNSCCYDNCMLAMLKEELDYFNLHNPFRRYNIKKQIFEKFWNGEYFKDEINKEYIAGDANVFPYWCGLFDSKKMILSSINAIKKEELDRPFPLKYTKNRNESRFLFPYNLLAPNYEGNTIWMHLGLCYLDVVEKADKKILKKYLEQYTKLINAHKTFLEVYTPDGAVYKTPFYYTDEGMLWVSKYLCKLKRFKN